MIAISYCNNSTIDHKFCQTHNIFQIHHLMIFIRVLLTFLIVFIPYGRHCPQFVKVQIIDFYLNFYFFTSLDIIKKWLLLFAKLVAKTNLHLHLRIFRHLHIFFFPKLETLAFEKIILLLTTPLSILLL